MAALAPSPTKQRRPEAASPHAHRASGPAPFAPNPTHLHERSHHQLEQDPPLALLHVASGGAHGSSIGRGASSPRRGEAEAGRRMRTAAASSLSSESMNGVADSPRPFSTLGR